MTPNKEVQLRTVEWLENVVIAHNLCPFAKAPFKKGQVKVVVEETTNPDVFFECVVREINQLDLMSAVELETTLLVVPNLFSVFDDYLDALAFVNQLICEIGWEGIYQVASFHPDYQFEGTAINDRSNFTNRAPYPIFHLIREDSMEKILKSYPDADNIPQRNIELMESLDQNDFEKLFYWKFKG